MLPFCLHHGDPLTFFKIDEFSKQIREDFKNGKVFNDLISKYITKNNFCLKLISLPD